MGSGGSVPNKINPSQVWFIRGFSIVIFFFPYNPPTPPTPTNPPPVPPRKAEFRSTSAPFGSVWLRFGSVWLRLSPFRLLFGSVSGRWAGSGWGRGEGLL